MKEILKIFSIHIATAILILILLIFGVFKFLERYTLLGEAVVVPDVREMLVPEAREVLNQEHLNIVVIDSVFTLDRTPGIIIEQNPVPNSKVKKNRQIYVVINAITRKRVPFPEITAHSNRQAQTILESLGLTIYAIEHMPSRFVNLVQFAKYDGEIINTGDLLPIGSGITLVVGEGLSDESIILPSFRALTLERVRQMCFENTLHLGATRFDVQPANPEEARQFFVYRQWPIAGTPVYLGEYIDVWLTRDRSKLAGDEPRFQRPPAEHGDFEIDLDAILMDIESSFEFEEDYE